MSKNNSLNKNKKFALMWVWSAYIYSTMRKHGRNLAHASLKQKLHKIAFL